MLSPRRRFISLVKINVDALANLGWIAVARKTPQLPAAGHDVGRMRNLTESRNQLRLVLAVAVDRNRRVVTLVNRIFKCRVQGRP